MKTLRYILVKAMADVVSVVESTFKAGVWLFLCYVLMRMGVRLVDMAFTLLHIYAEGFHATVIDILLFVVACVLAGDIIKRLPLFEWNDRLFTGQLAVILLGGTRWRDRCAGVLAWGVLLSVGAVVVGTLIADTFLTRYVMDGALYVVRRTSHWCGMDYRVTLMALLWFSAGLCMLSCLSLLIPVLRHKGDSTGMVYRMSGLVSIVLYTVGIAGSNLEYLTEIVFCEPRTQYAVLDNFVAEATLYHRHSAAYIVMHTFVLPTVLPTLLNVVILILLCRYNRRVEADGETALYEDVAWQEEETAEIPFANDAVTSASDLITDASDKATDANETVPGANKRRAANPKDDVKCFRHLTRIVIGMEESNGHLDLLLYEYTPRLVATLTDEDMLRIMNETGGYLRSRWLSVPVNARQFVEVVKEFGSFRAYIDSLTHPAGTGKEQPTLGLGTQAVMVANDMRWRGFKQVGPSRALELLGRMYGIRHPSINLPDFHVFCKHR